MIRADQNFLLRGFVFALLGAALSAHADYAIVPNATVKGILTDSIDYGGCAIEVTPSPSATFAECGADFIVFSCDGTFSTKSQASVKLGVAQLAMVTGGVVKYTLDTTKKHNGLCFAQRFDAYPAPN
jgi:hypothetical protein